MQAGGWFNRGKLGPVAILLLASTAAIYLRVAGFGFINYDDEFLLYRNTHVNTGLSLSNVAWAFTSMDFLQWAPLTWLSHMIDFEIFGSSPSAHHLVNVGFHLFNTLALLLLLVKVTGSRWRSAIVAALFALHPLHVEPVAWLSARKDLVSTAFFLLTLLSYGWYVDRPSVSRYLITATAFAASLMAKPMYVTLPFVLLLLDYWPLDRGASRHVPTASARWGRAARLGAEKAPLLVLAAVFAAVGYLSQARANAVTPFSLDQLATRASTTVVAYAHMLWRTVWPARLAVVYPMPASFSWAVLLASTLTLTTVTAVVAFCWRSRRYLLVGWLWFLLTLLPVSGVVKIGAALSADKFSYVPIVGLFLCAVWGVCDLLQGWTAALRGRVLAGIASVVMALCAVRSWQYLGCWRDNVALYTEALAVTERNFIVMGNLAAAHQAAGDFEGAMRYYEQSVQAEPRYEVGHSNLGYLWLRKRDCGHAIPHFVAALQLNPDYRNAEFGLAYCQRVAAGAPR